MRRVAVVALGVLMRPAHGEDRVFESGGKRMLGGEAVIHVQGEVTRLSELHPELAMALGTARNPAAAVQVNRDWMGPGALGHRNIGAQARAQFDVLMKGPNLGRPGVGAPDRRID